MRASCARTPVRGVHVVGTTLAHERVAGEVAWRSKIERHFGVEGGGRSGPAERVDAGSKPCPRKSAARGTRRGAAPASTVRGGPSQQHSDRGTFRAPAAGGVSTVQSIICASKQSRFP